MLPSLTCCAGVDYQVRSINCRLNFSSHSLRRPHDGKGIHARTHSEQSAMWDERLPMPRPCRWLSKVEFSSFTSRMLMLNTSMNVSRWAVIHALASSALADRCPLPLHCQARDSENLTAVFCTRHLQSIRQSGAPVEREVVRAEIMHPGESSQRHGELCPLMRSNKAEMTLGDLLGSNQQEFSVESSAYGSFCRSLVIRYLACTKDFMADTSFSITILELSNSGSRGHLPCIHSAHVRTVS